MELGRELMSVLDNPARVWRAIVANLAPETRVTLLTLTTCTTPIDLVDWQASIARVSVESASTFEASLRVLDDLFVTIGQDSAKRSFAQFRNPSMDDFCANYLDGNVGFAINAVALSPDLKQLSRLVQLASARSPTNAQYYRYPNIQSSLMSAPSILVKSLLNKLPSSVVPSEVNMEVADLLLRTISLGDRRGSPVTIEVKERLIPLVRNMSFKNSAGTLYKWLDNRFLASALEKMLGAESERFYSQLADSANALSHYDSLVNFSRTTKRPPALASWAEQFQDRDWLDESDNESVRGDLGYFEKIVEYLDLEVYDVLQEWESAVQEAEADEQQVDEVEWRGGGIESGEGTDPSNARTGLSSDQIVDAMFDNLLDRE